MTGVLDLVYLAMEQVPEGVVIICPQFKIKYINKSLSHLLEQDLSQSLEQDLNEVLPFLSLPNNGPTWSNLFKGEISGHCEVVKLKHPVSQKHLRLNYQPLFQEGEVLACLIMVKNLDKEISVQTKLYELEKRFQVMADSSPVLLWMSGTDAKCNFFNQTWLKFTGRTMEEELGEGWAQGVHPDDLNFCLNHYLNSFSKRKEFEMEYRLRRHDGQYRWVLDRGAPLYGPHGEFQGFIGSCTDITEQKESIKSLEKVTKRLTLANEELERFSYVASHDLQEPLRTIVNYSQLLQITCHENLTIEAKNYLDLLEKEARRSINLVKGLLEYSKMDIDKMKYTTLDLNQLVREVVKEMAPLIEQNEAQIFLANNLPCIQGIQIHLKQLFSNLLSNALKFKSSENPVVHIRCREEKGEWIIEVADNGIGFKNEYGQQIFNVFSRLHREEQYPGVGIGLSICQRVVQFHGGRIWAQSEPGKGSCFFFTLPRAQEAVHSMAQ